MDVEECDLRRVLVDRLQCGDTIAGPRHDAQLRPEHPQHVRQLVGEKRLVLREDGRGRGLRSVRTAP